MSLLVKVRREFLLLIPKVFGYKQIERSSHNTCTALVLFLLKSLGIVPVILKNLI